MSGAMKLPMSSARYLLNNHAANHDEGEVRIGAPRSISIAALLTALLLSARAQACPACAAGIRAQVHAGIFDEAFARNLVITALPFGVLAGILAAILFVPSGKR